jgi:putative DNA primase/helicase
MNGPRDANDVLREDGPAALRHMLDIADTTVDITHEPDRDDNRQAAEDGAGARSNVATATGWAEPCPLPSLLLPVAQCDLDLVPDALRPWLTDACERMQCPPDYLAASVMTALGSLIGRQVAIRPLLHDDWTEVGNMWACLVGRPGVMKSPAMSEARRFLDVLCSRAELDFQNTRIDRETKKRVEEALTAANKQNATKILKNDRFADVTDLLRSDRESADETLRRYIANDTSTESLGELLRENPNGLLVFRDELMSLLASLDEEGHISDRGFYLFGWAGISPYTFDRIGRGLHLRIEGVCISILGSTQPGRISQYLWHAIRGGRFDDGLMQRFGLLIWPDPPSEWKHIDRPPHKDARRAAQGVFDRLDRIDWRTIGAHRDRGPDGDEYGLPYLRLDDDSYNRFVQWRSEHERKLRGEDLHPALEAHLTKYRKLVPGLALISHLADVGRGPVTHVSMERAIRWATYLETHARRTYASVSTVEVGAAQAIIAKIRSGQLKTEFRSHDVWRPQWSRLSDRKTVQAGLDLLVDYGWLDCRKIQTAGRPAIVYLVNPKTFKQHGVG